MAGSMRERNIKRRETVEGGYCINVVKGNHWRWESLDIHIRRMNRSKSDWWNHIMTAPEYVHKRYKDDTDMGKLCLVYEAIKEVAMRMKITAAKDRVSTLRRNYCNALKSAAFGHLHVEKLHLVFEKLLRKRKAYALHKHMADTTKRRKDEGFHRENIDCIVKELASQSRTFQVEHWGSSAHNSRRHHREQSTERPQNKSHRLILNNNHRDSANKLTTQKDQESD